MNSAHHEHKMNAPEGWMMKAYRAPRPAMILALLFLAAAAWPQDEAALNDLIDFDTTLKELTRSLERGTAAELRTDRFVIHRTLIPAPASAERLPRKTHSTRDRSSDQSEKSPPPSPSAMPPVMTKPLNITPCASDGTATTWLELSE